MVNRPATGPRRVVRADGSTAYTTGAIHTLILRATDRLRPRPAQTPTAQQATETGR